MPKVLSETDLAGPLYEYLEQAGYTVRSEVKDCDIAAVKGDDLLVIELKKALNLALVVQGVRRQRLTDSVYLAIPRPSNKWKWWQESRGVQHLLRRLELGLILVSLERGKPAVEVVFHPLPFERRRRAAHRRAVLAEINGRTADYNRAGSSPHEARHGLQGECHSHRLLPSRYRQDQPRRPARDGHRSEDTVHPAVQRVRVVRARGSRRVRDRCARPR